MKPTAANLEELLEQACVSGSSGRGMSFWSVASRCGTRALLNEKQDALLAANGAQLSFASDKPVGKRVGSAYHKLHEWRHQGLLDGFDGLFTCELTDPSFIEARRCFEAYISEWPPSVWGRVLHTELPLANDFKGAGVVNARLDCVTFMSEQEAKRASVERDVPLPGEGTYIIDYKTEGMPHDARYYTASLQALWYPLIATHELTDVRGIIFDVLRKPRRKGESPTFHALFAPLNNAYARKQVVALLEQGAANISRGGNPAECIKFSIPKDDICPYFEKECTLTRRHG